MSENLERLIGPYEILDLEDGESKVMKISSWERGLMLIHPTYPGAPAEKEITVLRTHIFEGYKPTPPMYWDITSKTLQAQFVPMLAVRGFDEYEYVVKKFGRGVRARFTLERRPLA